MSAPRLPGHGPQREHGKAGHRLRGLRHHLLCSPQHPEVPRDAAGKYISTSQFVVTDDFKKANNISALCTHILQCIFSCFRLQSRYKTQRLERSEMWRPTSPRNLEWINTTCCKWWSFINLGMVHCPFKIWLKIIWMNCVSLNSFKIYNSLF